MALPWAGSLYQYPPGAGAEKRITPRKGPLPAADQKNELLRWVTKMRTNFTSEQIKAMIGIAEGSIKMLQDYITFLNNELEVTE